MQKISLQAPKNKRNSDDDIISDENSDIEDNKDVFFKSTKHPKKLCKPVSKHHGEDEDDEEEVEEENDEEEDDCNLEGDDDDDIEEYDEGDD